MKITILIRANNIGTYWFQTDGGCRKVNYTEYGHSIGFKSYDFRTNHRH